MSGQDHQARIALPHGVDHGGGVPQATPAADPGDVAELEQVRVGRQVDARWSGRICTWPVLTTDTRRMGSTPTR